MDDEINGLYEREYDQTLEPDTVPGFVNAWINGRYKIIDEVQEEGEGEEGLIMAEATLRLTLDDQGRVYRVRISKERRGEVVHSGNLRNWYFSKKHSAGPGGREGKGVWVLQWGFDDRIVDEVLELRFRPGREWTLRFWNTTMGLYADDGGGSGRQKYQLYNTEYYPYEDDPYDGQEFGLFMLNGIATPTTFAAAIRPEVHLEIWYTLHRTAYTRTDPLLARKTPIPSRKRKREDPDAEPEDEEMLMEDPDPWEVESEEDNVNGFEFVYITTTDHRGAQEHQWYHQQMPGVWTKVNRVDLPDVVAIPGSERTWDVYTGPSQIDNTAIRDVTTVRQVTINGRQQDLIRVWKMYSNYRALDIMHHILKAEWVLRSITLNTIPTTALPWARVKAGYVNMFEDEKGIQFDEFEDWRVDGRGNRRGEPQLYIKENRKYYALEAGHGVSNPKQMFALFEKDNSPYPGPQGDETLDEAMARWRQRGEWKVRWPNNYVQGGEIEPIGTAIIWTFHRVLDVNKEHIYLQSKQGQRVRSYKLMWDKTSRTVGNLGLDESDSILLRTVLGNINLDGQQDTWEHAAHLGSDDDLDDYTSLYLLLDRRKREITDRVVAKEFNLQQHGTECVRRGKLALLRHRQIQNLNSEYLLGWRGYSRKHHWLSNEEYKLYIEYAPFGTLHDLIEHYAEKNGGVGEKIPDMFVWNLFRNLMEACRALESQGWCHTEITPKSIFLKDHPGDGEECRAYYRPALGNFSALKPLTGRIIGPEGVDGWQTPEQRPPKCTRNLTRSGLHVYSIGLILFCLMNNIKGIPNGNLIIGPYTSDYPENLENLVRDCLSAEPADRISLDDLEGEIRTQFFDTPPGRLLRDREERHLQAQDRITLRDDYKIGNQAADRPW